MAERTMLKGGKRDGASRIGNFFRILPATVGCSTMFGKKFRTTSSVGNSFGTKRFRWRVCEAEAIEGFQYYRR
ncbi:unnamed protein product [Victoria cruziana]